ncbi:FAD-binding domain protein [Ceratobasidium sp. AG-Ba]|nr:FAD-binding domain protein [Ceratobasidium sp. AG-Ba]
MQLFFLLGLIASTSSRINAAPSRAMPIVEPRFPVFNYTITCINIARSVSNSSGVYYFGHPQYIKGNMHWASSSSQISACVVEPGNAQDLSTILKIVSNTSTPFGIRSGGHATNPGFSSTPGVQIALFKLNEVTYHPATVAADGSVGTVDIGSGLVWDDVYKTLQSQNVNVVGGRVTGVGVGGFILGGGYSWLSNQYGLTIDTVTAFEVVLPSGIITTASATTNPDLFWGLKGGFNNFGVVTKFTLLAFPQGQVWGGLTTYTEGQLAKLNNAVVDFVKTVNDPKASIIPAYNSIIGQPGVSLLMFYDGPTPPAGIFERFLSIPHFTSDVKTRSFTSLVQASPSDITYGTRGAFNTVSLKTYSSSLIEQVLNQTKFWGQKFAFEGALFISYDVEPFLQTMTSRSKGGAYPHDNFLMPLNLYYAWLSDTKDKMFTDAMEESAQVIYNQAVAEGQDIAGLKQIKYGNYAPASSNQDLRSIYGDNLPRLKQLKAQYDPTNTMGLAGGFRF